MESGGGKSQTRPSRSFIIRKELDMVPTGGCYYRIANPMPRVEIGHGKIKLGLQMGYSVSGFWALNSFPTFYYVIIPSLCFLSGVSVFPEITSPWCIPFIYSWSLMESLQCGDTAVEWWNTQRMWLMRRTTSYLLAAIDTIGGMLGISESGFELTVKVDGSQAMERYKKGKMEFGPISSIFVIITTISLFNLACLVLGLGRVLLREGAAGLGPLFLQPYISSGSCVGQVPHRTGHLSLKLRQRSGARGFGYMKNSKEDDDVLIEQLPELAIGL
ncbi:Cellulose synthase-like protein E2 [Hordeum vulgare]|nr:Cellulose synthase-like protein E2 [Hordeum vulgare]